MDDRLRRKILQLLDQHRIMTLATVRPDGWPDAANLELAQLRDELQRRWLMWYDELVRGGVTDFGALEDALLARQRAWEGTPHPRVGGRTPIEVITDQVRSN